MASTKEASSLYDDAGWSCVCVERKRARARERQKERVKGMVSGREMSARKRARESVTVRKSQTA